MPFSLFENIGPFSKAQRGNTFFKVNFNIGNVKLHKHGIFFSKNNLSFHYFKEKRSLLI